MLKRIVLVVVMTFCVAVSALAQTNWTGDGGRGKSIAIVAPRATGLPANLNYLPVLVQGELVSNFTMFSAITVLDRQNYEAQLLELMEEIYSDRARESLNLGNLPHTDYLMDGTITRTAAGYNLQVRVMRTSDQTTVATHSATSTFAELDNLTSVRRASLELLQRMGVSLTEQARATLGGAATTNHVNAQTALAQGIVAQRQGTEVTALSYFYQAAAFDPSLAEAVGRSQVMSANITGANIGENIRNDIIWRREWVARLRETEEIFHRTFSTAAPPYTLFYSTDILTGNINYQRETADLSIQVKLIANEEWFNAIKQALEVVMTGLLATNRIEEWGLNDWPRQGLSNTNPFHRQWSHDITVEFELVNERNQIIGRRQTIRFNPHFEPGGSFISIKRTGRTLLFIFMSPNRGAATGTITFRGIKADDISDQLTIRLTRVNGQPPETARFPIVALSENEFRFNTNITYGSFTDSRDNQTYRTVTMPDGKTWMAENLNFNPGRGNSWCYDNNTVNCVEFGRLYDWNTAMAGARSSDLNPSRVRGVCPVGWHLPSYAEWQGLILAVDREIPAMQLKSAAGWSSFPVISGTKVSGNGINKYGFSALPGGRRIDRFGEIGHSGFWWTATENDDYPNCAIYGRMYNRFETVDLEGLSLSIYCATIETNKATGLSVRCVRDD